MPDPGDLGALLALDGKTALVTGGSGGIGGAVCALFARAGARVLSVDLPGLPAPDGTEGFACDLSDGTGCDLLFDELARRGDGIDVLVHSAGIARDGVLWKLSDQDWRDVIATNLDSAFRLLRRAAPTMRARGGGSIVLISSINGERGKFGQSNYAASKAGLIGLARSAARELGRFRIRVNVVSPGMIRSSMSATLAGRHVEKAREEAVLGRIGEPEDVARAALFLAGELSRHVTGQVLRVDGGQLIG